jgi:hypothetical protein
MSIQELPGSALAQPLLITAMELAQPLQIASIKLQINALDRSHDETAELASKVFKLSQRFISSGSPPATTPCGESSKSCV